MYQKNQISRLFRALACANGTFCYALEMGFFELPACGNDLEQLGQPQGHISGWLLTVSLSEVITGYYRWLSEANDHVLGTMC